MSAISLRKVKAGIYLTLGGAFKIQKVSDRPTMWELSTFNKKVVHTDKSKSGCEQWLTRFYRTYGVNV